MFFFFLFPRHSDFGCASLNPIKLFICMVVVILFIRKGFSPSFFTSLAFVPFQFIHSHCKSCSTISWKTKRSIWLKLSLLVIDASLITLASMTKRISRQLHVQSKWFHFSTRFGSVFASHFSVYWKLSGGIIYWILQNISCELVCWMLSSSSERNAFQHRKYQHFRCVCVILSVKYRIKYRYLDVTLALDYLWLDWMRSRSIALQQNTSAHANVPTNQSHKLRGWKKWIYGDMSNITRWHNVHTSDVTKTNWWKKCAMERLIFFLLQKRARVCINLAHIFSFSCAKIWQHLNNPCYSSDSIVVIIMKETLFLPFVFCTKKTIVPTVMIMRK